MPADVSRLHRVALGVAALAACLFIGALTWRLAGPSGGDDPTASGRTAFAIFERTVVPVLNRRCSNCHGVDTATDALMRETSDNEHLLRWVVGDDGRIATPAHVELAYTRSRVGWNEAAEFKPLDLESPAPASPFARAPLAPGYSGYMRGHPTMFSSPDDADYQAIVAWIDAEREVRGEALRQAESEAERFFSEQVTPILTRKTCFGANCHGPLAFNDLKLDAGIPALRERFTPAINHFNRQAMLGDVTRLVHLAGDITQSKQLLKNIPVSQGGIVHKGGNNFFDKGDPDYRVLESWLRLEAQELSDRTGTTIGEQRGLLFVRRPRSTPERFFEDASFMPGGDLFWLAADGEINLTAALHPGRPADVRAPEVSYDATKVAFAMRRGDAEPFNVWEIDLASRAARQLTYSADPDVHFLEPLYVPDPDDDAGDDLSRVSLVVVSNLADEWAQSSPEGILGEADGGTRSSIVDGQLRERPGTFDGRHVRIVRGTNAGEVRRITAQDIGSLTVDRPFSRASDSTTHYVIESGPRMAPKYDAYRMRLAEPGGEVEAFNDTLARMTFSPSQTRRPVMRSSGEVMFTFLRTGWQSGRPFFNASLFRQHVDGSNFHTHNGNRSGVPIHADSRELPNGLEIRVGRDADSYWGGMLILSDHQFGINIEPDNPVDDLDHPWADGPPASSQHRFVPGWLALDPDVTFRGVSPGGAYRDPRPLPDGSVVVAHAPGPVDLADPEASPNFDIVRLVPDPAFQSDDGFRAGQYRREVVVSGPAAELWPTPIVVRPKESVAKKLKTEESVFGPIQTVRSFAGYPEGTPAVVQVFDHFLLDAFFEQITPAGRRRLALPVNPATGEVTPEVDRVEYVRIVGVRPQHEGDSGPPQRFMIAEAPLEADGSFYAMTPSGVGFDLQSLNSRRMALRSPNRWLYAHPGEKHTLAIPRALFPQTCGGCHGALTGEPVDTLRQPDGVTSASLTEASWDLERHRKRRPVNDAPDGVVQLTTVYFDRDIRPILQARCVSCHSPGRAGTTLNLNGEQAFEALRELVDHREALSSRSYLVEKLTGLELYAARTLSGDAPHPSERPLAEEELVTIIRWIDLGASRHNDEATP
ncbi:MAG: hypothetical protein QGF21_00250 [Vicinamibacterales bacterium]|nr:hypothetical protein [Acidobacteriota bacterium]MDP7473022.1 hypothetical protein [Vicinamibacterales bacterium]MDP7670354.1 hypothetical protein [Vicinamibacterales bacterium]HJO38011.1 hypothetical protein [Vicinamibacterales bacterium]|tara:strand:+ start:3245 stop:6547 length:3303 start_codon:yes stop_codon:yes gene_type:complete